MAHLPFPLAYPRELFIHHWRFQSLRCVRHSSIDALLKYRLDSDSAHKSSHSHRGRLLDDLHRQDLTRDTSTAHPQHSVTLPSHSSPPLYSRPSKALKPSTCPYRATRAAFRTSTACSAGCKESNDVSNAFLPVPHQSRICRKTPSLTRASMYCEATATDGCRWYTCDGSMCSGTSNEEFGQTSLLYTPKYYQLVVDGAKMIKR